MIFYYCDKCQKIHDRTDYVEYKNGKYSCKACKENNRIHNITLKSKLYWCNDCNIPIHDQICGLCGKKGKYITTDLRPVFPEERLLLEVLQGEPFKYKDSSVWNGAGNRYIVDGKKLKITIKDLMKNDSNKVRQQIEENTNKNSYDKFNEYIKKFVQANKGRFNSIVSMSTDEINKDIKGYGFDQMFVSFSGGKDSTVVSDLVTKALSKPRIIHIFGDTTLEFPLTLEYVTRFRKNNRKTPMLVAKNKEKNFYDLCDVIGAPSRVMRWCCGIFKTGPINSKISSAFKNKKRILTFYGIRRSESVKRSNYERESESPKITKQKVVSPIIYWFDFDIWLYILSTGIDFNDAYRLGYSRVGCWCCPNNSDWATYLSRIYMLQQYNDWRNLLINFAKKIGKPDAEVYVDEGKWKARQGGNGISFSKNSIISFKPCANENDAFSYELRKEITEELYQLFKPFGYINKEIGNKRLGEVYVVDKNNNPIMRLQGRINSKTLKVTILKLPIHKAKSLTDAKKKIDAQITKYQMCMGCLGCESVCRFDAISVVKSASEKEAQNKKIKEKYEIDDNKCVRCGECVQHFDGGCYIRKVLAIKRGG
ncbi:phosphoadenosine phosphosulfate reductase family protein [Tepidibacter hydrothermalis]|uniref:Phosphoadenosine phosphosulfate reductase family protein n=1 Tax=Tepidibacter hydrothermalis TaxID=3036126 RepID=A0ABY8EI80_9FIRM|nr:phosphoadenosine phosphosulfate reductase family protein [Tepidibacter hydrothermalis]WFD11307.1 phosphoadenosine phosphosulfate reductase family protein [Tepidibacter hydrothermalis]